MSDEQSDRGAAVPGGRAVIAARAAQYMSERMAMRDPDEDQEQNWILGHLVTFAEHVAAALSSSLAPGIPVEQVRRLSQELERDATADDIMSGVSKREMAIEHGASAATRMVLKRKLDTLITSASAQGAASLAVCGAFHPQTGAYCELPPGHENHRGQFNNGIAQWPTAASVSRPAPPPVPAMIGQGTDIPHESAAESVEWVSAAVTTPEHRALIEYEEHAPPAPQWRPIAELLAQWQSDIDDCPVCKSHPNTVCEHCFMTARHIGALQGTLLRADPPPSDAPAAQGSK